MVELVYTYDSKSYAARLEGSTPSRGTNMKKPKVVSVVGPTASGKTDLAVALAEKYNGEVISCDSRQVYRHLDIGTAKVTEEEMHGVPHHLLDVVNVLETYTAADFKSDANSAIADVLARSKTPIIAGGTFFYLDQLRGRGVGPEVPTNESLRETLEELSTEALFTQLQEKDPVRAGSIDPKNKRRLIRALEIIDTLGTVPEMSDSESEFDWFIIGIDVPKNELCARFRKRAQHWLETGIVDETKWLLSQINDARFKEFGFEYTVTKGYVDGTTSEEELKQRFIEKNWQYAKRQLTWLKRDNDIRWYKTEQLPTAIKDVGAFLG